MTETPGTEASGFGVSRMPYMIGLDMPAVFTNVLVSLGRKTVSLENRLIGQATQEGVLLMMRLTTYGESRVGPLCTLTRLRLGNLAVNEIEGDAHFRRLAE